MAHDEVLPDGGGRLELGERGRRSEVSVLLVEAGRVDVVDGDPSPHVLERPLDVEAERAPFLPDRLVEVAEPAAERTHQPGKVAAPDGIGPVAARGAPR